MKKDKVFLFKSSLRLLAVATILFSLLCFTTALAQKESQKESQKETQNSVQQQVANAYTVQLASLNSQEDSQAIRDALRQSGYMAYVVQDNNSYHLRIGYFINPEAAQQYASALLATPNFQDGFAQDFETGFGSSFQPTAIVAEGIAQNEFPISTEILMSYPYMPEFATLKVHEWAGQGRALRFQGRFELANFEASYLVLNGFWDHSPFGAWRADGEPDGSLVRVFNDLLWPEDIEGMNAMELAKIQEERLERIADSMDLPANSFGLSIFNEPGRGRPYVIRAQRVNASTGNIESYPALGIPTITGVKTEGPELKWFDRGFVDEVPETVTKEVADIFGLLQKDAASDIVSVKEGAALNLDGNAWQSFAFENLSAVRVANGDSWLAVAGTPLWAYEDYLVVEHAGEVLLYRVYLTQ